MIQNNVLSDVIFIWEVFGVAADTRDEQSADYVFFEEHLHDEVSRLTVHGCAQPSTAVAKQELVSSGPNVQSSAT